MSGEEAPRGTCPHCVAALRPVEVELPGGRRKAVAYEECGCDGARAAAAARAAAEGTRREGELRRAGEERLARAGVPRRYLRASHPWAADLCDKAQREDLGAYITGPVGAGKTHLACALAAEGDRRGMRVRFATSVGLLAGLRASCDRDGIEAAMRPLERCDLLVVDDLGKEKPTAWALEQLFRLVDSRYSAMRPTVVTTQLRRPALQRRLAQGDEAAAAALCSRLAEMCVSVVVDGPDRRLAQGRAADEEKGGRR